MISPGAERWIFFDLARNDPRQEPRLDLQNPPVADLVSEDGMGYLRAHPPLVPGDHRPLPLRGHGDANAPSDEVLLGKLAVIEEGDRCRVSDEGPKLLHHVESEGGLAVPRPVIEPQVGVEADGQEGDEDVLHQYAVEVGEDGVRWIFGRPLVPVLKGENARLGLEEAVEPREVCLSCGALDPQEALDVLGLVRLFCQTVQGR